MSIVERGSNKAGPISLIVKGIVRRYHVPDRTHCPYVGMLKTEKDEYPKSHLTLQTLLEDASDGEAVIIKVTFHGEHPNAKGYHWMLTKPNHYERIKKEQAGDKKPGELEK